MSLPVRPITRDIYTIYRRSTIYLILVLSFAQFVETSVKVTSNSPSQGYTRSGDHNLPAYFVFVFLSFTRRSTNLTFAPPLRPLQTNGTLRVTTAPPSHLKNLFRQNRRSRNHDGILSSDVVIAQVPLPFPPSATLNASHKVTIVLGNPRSNGDTGHIGDLRLSLTLC